MDEATWKGWFNADGTPKIRQEEMRREVFRRGVSPDGSLRREVWPFLLGVYEWDVNQEKRLELWEAKRYVRLAVLCLILVVTCLKGNITMTSKTNGGSWSSL